MPGGVVACCLIAVAMNGTIASAPASATPTVLRDKKLRRVRPFIFPPSKPDDCRQVIRREGDGGSSRGVTSIRRRSLAFQDELAHRPAGVGGPGDGVRCERRAGRSPISQSEHIDGGLESEP